MFFEGFFIEWSLDFYEFRTKMVIRKIKQQEKIAKKRMLSTMIAIVVIVVLIKLIPLITPEGKPEPQRPEYDEVPSIGTDVIIFGKVEEDNNFPLYTHKMNDKRDYGLKGSQINLNKFIDLKVEIEGTVTSMKRDLPIIDVKTIKIPDQNLIIQNNRYFFTNDLIELDFSQDFDLQASYSWEFIEILFDDLPIVKVKNFICSKISDSQDCETLAINYKYEDRENFISYLWHTFYRHDNKNWITFNDNVFGYLFKPDEDQTLLDISHMINIINNETIMTNKSDLLYQRCRSEDDRYKELRIESIVHNWPKSIIVNIEWITENNKDADCSISFDLRNNWEITDTSFRILE